MTDTECKTVDDRAYFSQHWEDDEGNHQGGQAYGPGFAIAWQRGQMFGGLEKNQNGALIITLLSVLIDKLLFFQSGKFHCEENAKALELLIEARSLLDSRKNRRKASGTLGTTTP